MVARDGFGVDAAYDVIAVRPFRAAAVAITVFDRARLEPVVTGTGTVTQRFAASIQARQDGNVQRYLSAALTGVAAAIVVVAVVVVTVVA
jgi:hypothetical protein